MKIVISKKQYETIVKEIGSSEVDRMIKKLNITIMEPEEIESAIVICQIKEDGKTYFQGSRDDICNICGETVIIHSSSPSGKNIEIRCFECSEMKPN